MPRSLNAPHDKSINHNPREAKSFTIWSYKINQDKADVLLVSWVRQSASDPSPYRKNQHSLTGNANSARVSRLLLWRRLFPIPDDDTLVLSVNDHVSEHIICQSIDMWWVFILCLEKQKKQKQNHGQRERHVTFLFLVLAMDLLLYSSNLKACISQEFISLPRSSGVTPEKWRRDWKGLLRQQRCDSALRGEDVFR